MLHGTQLLSLPLQRSWSHSFLTIKGSKSMKIYTNNFVTREITSSRPHPEDNYFTNIKVVDGS